MKYGYGGSINYNPMCGWCRSRRNGREEETMCQRHHHPPPGSVTGERGEREDDTRRGGRDEPRCCEREEGGLSVTLYLHHRWGRTKAGSRPSAAASRHKAGRSEHRLCTLTGRHCWSLIFLISSSCCCSALTGFTVSPRCVDFTHAPSSFLQWFWLTNKGKVWRNALRI